MGDRGAGCEMCGLRLIAANKKAPAKLNLQGLFHENLSASFRPDSVSAPN